MIDWNFVITFIVAFGIYEFAKKTLTILVHKYLDWYTRYGKFL